MVDRMASVGGTLAIESAPGHGTIVRGRLPTAGAGTR
jgi:signal transduction histidine kinase